MGEVYRARDPRLAREVAIKVLPEQFSKDPQALARFDRSLDDPSLHWFAWHKTGFQPWTPPPVGGRVVLPAQSFLDAVFGK